jgi:hypothetical protein
MPHDRMERRSLELHRAIAAKLRQQPELLQIAHDNLDRWSRPGHRSQPYLDTWREMLAGPLDAVLAAMTEETPRMTELRQSSPFAGVLDPKERWHIYDTFEAEAVHRMDGMVCE